MTTEKSQPQSDPVPPPPAMMRVDVGPMITLPFGRLMLAAFGASVMVGAIGWVAVLIFAPLPKVPWASASWAGVGAVVLADWAGILAMRPWAPRRLGKWPFVWLIGRGVSFAGVLILAVLIYSATQPRPLAFGLAIAAGHFAALLAEVAVYAAHVRSVTGEDAPSQLSE